MPTTNHLHSVRPALVDAVADMLCALDAHSPVKGLHDMARAVAGAVRRNQQDAVDAAIELAEKSERLSAAVRFRLPLEAADVEVELLELEAATLSLRLAGTLAGWRK